MRFRRLALLAYGKFTDVSLNFTDGLPDLHLVYGPNEAGKSTLRSGAADFLYGIPGQTTLNFQHDYKRMRLGAVVEGGGLVLELTRRKGNKGTLRDIDDEPAPDSLLEDLLGGDRAFYERMFALSHERLRAGGEEILQGKDDAAETLFAAAAGLSGLHEARRKLEDEAKELWTPRKPTSSYQIQAKALKQAAAERDQATAQARDWQAAADALQQANDTLETAKAEQSRLEGRRTKLERVRGVAPHLRARRQAQSDRAALEGAPLLPEDAAVTIREIRAKLALAENEIERLGSEVEQLVRQAGEIRPDEALLVRAKEIEDLAEERSSLRRHESGIINRQAEAKAASERMLRAARDLGWADAADRALESQAPPRMARAELRALLERRGAVEQRLEAACTSLEERRGEHEGLVAQLDRLDRRRVSPEWKAALDSARALGDTSARRSSLVDAVTKARREWEQAVAALHPWQGTAEQLRLRPAVSAEQAREWIEEQRACDAGRGRITERTREIEEALREKRLQREQLVRDRAPVTGEQVAALRQSRDYVWNEIASGALQASEVRVDYERAVAEADAVADRRFEGAEAAGEWTSLTNEIERLEQRMVALRHEREGEENRAATLSERWRSLAEQLGDAGFRLADYPMWLNSRDSALEKASVLATAEAGLTAFDAAVRQAAASLRACWQRESGSPAEDGADDLGAWVARTEGVHESLSQAAGRQSRLIEQAEQVRLSCERAEQAALQAEREWQDWRDEWRRCVLAVGLPEGTSPEKGAAALEAFNELDSALEDRREKQERIAKMQEDLEQFASDARRLAEALAPEWVDRPGQEVVTELVRRLAEAREASQDRVRLAKYLEKNRADLAKAEAQMFDANASLRPLLEDAGAADLDALQAAVERSDRARALDASIAKTADDALQAGSPLDLAALEAEMDAEDGNDLAAELSTIKTELENVQQRLQDAVKKQTDAEHALAQFGAGDAAARAEARRQEALAEMIDVSGRWVRATVGHKLLGWAIQRYRESHQGPLLHRAGELFRLLTLGSFERLTVEDDGDKAAILALRSGDLIGVDAMSDGTRDQLYLALRVAALELHLDKGEPLPFLADDLFVNWDNERAKAGLRLLAELAGRTQVLFLTHHEHLLDLAREAVGSDCSIVRLPN